MKLKKDRGRFTVRFDMENPDHVRAVEYLERQRDRGKAQYLTDAILCCEKAETNSFPRVDRTLIEQVVFGSGETNLQVSGVRNQI